VVIFLTAVLLLALDRVHLLLANEECEALHCPSSVLLEMHWWEPEGELAWSVVHLREDSIGEEFLQSKKAFVRGEDLSACTILKGHNEGAIVDEELQLLLGVAAALHPDLAACHSPFAHVLELGSCC
jgi:hypothetical protein